MATGGDDLMDDDGAERLNDAGEVAMGNTCEQDCGTRPGPLAYPSPPPGQSANFCLCCVPEGWTLIAAGASSTGPQHLNDVESIYGDTGEQTIEAPAFNGDYSVQDLLGLERELGTFSSLISALYKVNALSTIVGGGLASLVITHKCVKAGFSPVITYATPGDPTSAVTGYAWDLQIWAQDFGGEEGITGRRQRYQLFYGRHTFTADEAGQFHFDCNSELAFTEVDNPLDGQAVEPGSSVTWQVIKLNTGATVTLKPCMSAPPPDQRFCESLTSNAGVCVFTYQASTATNSSATSWSDWTLVSTVHYDGSGIPPLPPGPYGVPIISKTSGGGCTATLQLLVQPTSAGTCPVILPPAKLSNSVRCPPPDLGTPCGDCPDGCIVWEFDRLSDGTIEGGGIAASACDFAQTIAATYGVAPLSACDSGWLDNGDGTYVRYIVTCAGADMPTFPTYP